MNLEHPAQHPSFFRIYITPLGLGLIQSISSLKNSSNFISKKTTMAFSTPACIFTSPNFILNQPPSPSRSVRYTKSKSPPISASFATAERTTSNSARSTRIATPSSLYDVLGIQIGADTVEIKAAYRKLARVLHPDVGKCDASADEFMKLHSAYSTLSDPGKRADYDRSLFLRQKMGVRSSSPAGYGGYSGRRWETDQCW